MPRPLQPFPFHDRRPSAVVRQSGSGRTTLHLELASSGTRAAAARGSRGRGGGGFFSRASGNGSTASATGWRGRRGWWGSARRVPSFVEFWGLSRAETTTVPVEQTRNDQEQQEQQGVDCTIGLLRSPEALIIVLGTASLLAFIVFIWGLVNDRQLQPMAVIVFVAAGTYCLALLKQQRVLAAAEQALVIEIIDGSSTAAADSSRRIVISKEDRRALFHYFTFRPPGKAKTSASAETNGAAREGGDAEVAGHTSGGALRALRRSRSWSLSSALGRSTRQDLQGSTAGHESTERVAGPPPPPRRSRAASGSVAPPPATEATMEEGRMERGEGMPTAGAAAVGGTMSAGGDETATPAPSSGASLATAEAGPAGPSCDSAAASGGDGETAGAIREGRGDDSDSTATAMRREGSGSRERPEEEKEAPERGVARGNSQQWSTAGSCIVCFGEYADGDNLCRLPCRHTYHAECIDAWLDGPDHAWCPLCKSSLLPLVRPIGSTTTTTTTTTTTNAITNAAASRNSNHGSAAGHTDTSNGDTATGGLAPPAATGNPAILTGDEAV